MTNTVTAEAAYDILVAEGFAKADVTAAIDSLIDAGLETPDEQQLEDGYVLAPGEVAVVRDQLLGR